MHLPATGAGAAAGDRGPGPPAPGSIGVRLFWGGLAATTLVATYLVLHRTGMLSTLMEGDALHQLVVDLGYWGPAAVIGLMALAILVSPIPSAPIALAAGAAYGHIWGTLYVLIGAEIGAVAAFGIARLVGHEVLRKWFGERISAGWIGSQNALMGVVFFSRLLPFVSFDVVSYAAGLTVLSFWRFALATLAGIAPTSFLLAHFGGEFAAADPDRMLYAAVALGALTLIPAVVVLVRKRLRRAPAADAARPQRFPDRGSGPAVIPGRSNSGSGE